MDGSIEENRGACQRHEKSGGREGGVRVAGAVISASAGNPGTHGGFQQDDAG